MAPQDAGRFSTLFLRLCTSGRRFSLAIVLSWNRPKHLSPRKWRPSRGPSETTFSMSWSREAERHEYHSVDRAANGHYVGEGEWLMPASYSTATDAQLFTTTFPEVVLRRNDFNETYLAGKRASGKVCGGISPEAEQPTDERL